MENTDRHFSTHFFQIYRLFRGVFLRNKTTLTNKNIRIEYMEEILSEVILMMIFKIENKYLNVQQRKKQKK